MPVLEGFQEGKSLQNGGGEDQLFFLVFFFQQVIDMLSSEYVVGTGSLHRFKGKLSKLRGKKSTQELLNI